MIIIILNGEVKRKLIMKKSKFLIKILFVSDTYEKEEVEIGLIYISKYANYIKKNTGP